MEENIAILGKATSGVLAVSGEDDYPYAVPLSFAYSDSKIYFHCARSGHKLDAIAQNPKASFCVIDRDDVVREEYTTYYRSVIAFGRARMMEGDAQKRAALELLCEKYSMEQGRGCLEEIERSLARMCLVELAIEHMTGKEALELAREKRPEDGSLHRL